MSYTIVTTPGFVISSQAYGEAGKLLSIFTRDIGLVLAGAQGIRLEKSKLRYGAQDHSFGQYSLVRGREFWRLTDAQANDSVKNSAIISRIGSLLKRLLHGEEAHPQLYDCVAKCADFLQISPDLDDQRLSTLESLTVARILYHLGYIGDDKELNGHLHSNEVVPVLLGALNDKRTILNKHINKALKESHL